MYYGSDTVKIDQKDCYISCYFLRSKVIKNEMIELIKIIKTVFVEQAKPVTVNFPNIGFSYVFESLNDIQNFELTITIFIPYIMDNIFSRIDASIEKEKKNFEDRSSDVVPA
jgi:hypothetical protein